MQNLVDRLRALTHAETTQYTVGSITYWSDDHLQERLDRHATYLTGDPLIWQTQYIDGTVNYLTANARWKNLEEAESGTGRWIVRDSTGAENGTANYSATYDTGRLTWTADQGGTAYYLTGYSYDLHAAAIEVLEEKLAYIDLWYDFGADGANYNRGQVVKNLQSLINFHRRKVGENAPYGSGEVMISQFVRTDLSHA